MDTTKSLLDQLKARYSLRSDYALAKFLNVTTVSMSRWRGGGSLSDNNAMRVAELLGKPPAYVLACMAAERAADLESSGVWRQIADAFKDKVAVMALASALFFSGLPGDQVHAAGLSDLRDNVYYGKRRRAFAGRTPNHGKPPKDPSVRTPSLQTT